MKNRLPEKLTALRKHFGYPQNEVAEKIGVPVQAFLDWENGNAIPSIRQCKLLADIYKVPLQDLADHTRTVTLPRLDTENDSIQIPFATSTDASDFAEDLIDEILPADEGTIQFGAIQNEPKAQDLGATRVMNVSDLEKTEVTKIVEEKPKETVHKTAAPKKSTGSKKKQKTMMIAIIACVVVAVLVLVFSLFSSKSVNVSMNNTNRLALGDTFSMYLRSQGDLVTAGTAVPELDSKDLVQVSAGGTYALGLKKDGTVVCAGSTTACAVEKWKEITMIAAGETHSVGLKQDGTVVCSGAGTACDTTKWKDITAVYAGDGFTIGVGSDHKAQISGNFSSRDRIMALTNISSITVGTDQIAVTDTSGVVTCYAIGNQSTSNTAGWTGMDATAVGSDFAAGLSKGVVKVATVDDEMVKEVSAWANVSYIAARGSTLIAVCNNQVIGVGPNTYNVYGTQEAEPTASAEPEKLLGVKNVQFSVTAAGLTVSWDKVADADYYEVSVDTDPVYSVHKSVKNSVSIPSDKLEDGKEYTFTIDACTNDGRSSDPSLVQYTYEANLIELTAPTSFTAKQVEKKIELNWSAVKNAGTYIVLFQDAQIEVRDNRYTIDAEGLPDGEYTIELYAKPAEDQKKYADSQHVTTTFTYKAPITVTALTMPTLLVSEVNEDGSWKLTWNTVNDASGYKVQVGDKDLGTINATTTTVTGLKNGEYTITITAIPADSTKNTETTYSGRWTYEYNKPQETKPETTGDPAETGSDGDKG